MDAEQAVFIVVGAIYIRLGLFAWSLTKRPASDETAPTLFAIVLGALMVLALALGFLSGGLLP